MKFFFTSLLLNIKKLALRRAAWAMLILLPLLLSVGAIFILRPDTQIITVNAGVYFDRDCLYESRVFEALTGAVSETYFVNFLAYDDKERLIEDVRFSRVDCGYILSPLIAVAAERDLIDIVTLVTSPRSVMAPGLNELVAAAVFRVISEDIAVNWLRAGFDDNEAIEHFIAAQFEIYEQSDIFMTPIHTAQTGPAEELAPNLGEVVASRVFHGLIGLAILILAIFYIPPLLAERHSGLQTALRACGKLGAYDISLFSAVSIVMFALGTAGLSAVALLAPHLMAGAITEIAALLGYVLVCAVLMMLTVRLLKSAALIQSLGLFIVLANVFFGGVLLNLYEISPGFARIQYLFPLFWYVEAVALN